MSMPRFVRAIDGVKRSGPRRKRAVSDGSASRSVAPACSCAPTGATGASDEKQDREAPTSERSHKGTLKRTNPTATRMNDRDEAADRDRAKERSGENSG